MFAFTVSVFFILLSVLTPSFCYIITVDADAEECFFDKVEAGTKMGMFIQNEMFWYYCILFHFQGLRLR